jgi:hypothetical protein
MALPNLVTRIAQIATPKPDKLRPAKQTLFSPHCLESAMSVVSATRAELRKLGATTSTEGQTALALAGILDAHHGAMGAAGTADRLMKIMAELRGHQPAAKSDLDKIRERRASRAAG